MITLQNAEQLIDAVAEAAVRWTGADAIFIFLRSLDGDSLALQAASAGAAAVAAEGGRYFSSLASTVDERGEGIVVDDLQAEPLLEPLPEVLKTFRVVVGLPLVERAQRVGVMIAAYEEAPTLGAHEMDRLRFMASQAGGTVATVLLREEAQSRLEKGRVLNVLNEVALSRQPLSALDQVGERVMAALRSSLGVEYLVLFLLNQERGVLEPLACDAAHRWEADEWPVGEGLLGWVAAQGTSLCVGDVTRDARYRQFMTDIRSALIVPLQGGEQVMGVVGAFSPRVNAFDADDEEFMETVARQMAIVVENVRLYAETEQRLKEVSTLYRLARQMNSSLDIQSVLDSIVESMRQAMDCRGASIALLDPIDNMLEIRAAAGISGKWRRDFKLKLGEGVAGQVLLEGKPMYVADTAKSQDFIFFDPAVRSLMAVPLSVKQRMIGTLSVDSDRPYAFTEADERLLTIAASQAAIAIENARLYAGLERRARKLAEAYTELREADRLKDEMVQNISHELRTPLTFVKGYVELLLSEDVGPLTEDQRDYLSIVAEKTDAVTRLVSDIIFLQQADRVPGKKVPIALDKLATRALRGCAGVAETSNLRLVANVPDGLPPVAGDEGRLLQVFDNLLGNAIKFSPHGGRIEVSVEDGGDMVCVSVSDDGIGIPKGQQERIFEMFYQVDGSARRRFGGTGLGLAIAKRIVEAHQGEIWVESEPGRGSVFRFTVPKYREQR
jgi:signal transduction histidine kinase